MISPVMQQLVKVLVSVAVILSVSWFGKKWPSLGGLVATMPLTAFLVLVWLQVETGGDRTKLVDYSRGATFGIPITMLFFLAVWLLLRRGTDFHIAVGVGFAIWLTGAAVHQLFLR